MAKQAETGVTCMMSMLSGFAQDESGATAIDYSLIAGLVPIVIVAALSERIGEASMVLICLAAAGLIMGFYFNAYALLASCLVAAVAAMVSAIEVGIAQAGFSLILGLIVIQIAYAVGLLASSLLSASTRASLPTARLRE